MQVLFVCLGNICRSPTAHGVFQQVLVNAGVDCQIGVDSAGTAGYHIGAAPDPRSVAAARTRGYDLSELRARQVDVGDFERFDYILAMDQSNLDNLQRIRPADFSGHLGLFLDFAQAAEREVPDPYYGGRDGFDYVLDLAEDASHGLLRHIRTESGI